VAIRAINGAISMVRIIAATQSLAAATVNFILFCLDTKKLIVAHSHLS